MKWITAARGVRYYEHKTRKHGIMPDRNYVVYFRRDGKPVYEKIGWASEGWTLEKALNELHQLKANYRTGTGPVTLQEKRELEQVRKANEQIRAEQLDKESMTFSSLFEIYLKQQQADSKKSWEDEQRLFKNWIQPVIGKLRLLDIAPIHFERIKSNMKATSKRKDWGGLSARSISYCLAVCRQVFNYGRKQDHFHGDNPVSKVKKPVADNRRMRFLSHEEAQILLDEIRVHSVLTYRITLISLHCGLRFGEIAGLTWQDLNFQNDTILIRNPKNGQTRVTFMSEAVKSMFLEMEPGKAGGFVFQNSGENYLMSQIPDSFMKAVNKLKLNDSIEDSRLKVVFHTCRHSFASWLVADGTDLFTVRELMGHKSIAMTARYSHLSPDTLRKAFNSMESARSQSKVIQIHLAG
jgi:site-specific recombinase XerD